MKYFDFMHRHLGRPSKQLVFSLYILLSYLTIAVSCKKDISESDFSNGLVGEYLNEQNGQDERSITKAKITRTGMNEVAISLEHDFYAENNTIHAQSSVVFQKVNVIAKDKFETRQVVTYKHLDGSVRTRGFHFHGELKANELYSYSGDWKPGEVESSRYDLIVFRKL